METIRRFLALLLFSACLFVEPSSSSKKINPAPIVCDPHRFSRLGLDVGKFSFCNQTWSFSHRAEDLVGRMTLEEKVSQLGNTAPAVNRLGLPAYQWWSEALHGVSSVGGGSKFDRRVPGATSFPLVILTASSFNETLWKAIGEAVSTEARAMNNLGLAGLTFWSPNINVVRDPRWGRALETPGEDPFVVGRYGVAYVRGLQDVKVKGSTHGNAPNHDPSVRPLKVSACCKHYVAYDLDNWHRIDRFHFDAKVTERDMIETFQRPFEMCVKEGDVSSVMCSYNSVNGVPTCADPKLLLDTVRGKWKLNGYIVSDCDSIATMHDGLKYLNGTQEDEVALALRAGLDLNCGNYYQKFGKSAVEKGKINETAIDKALINTYIVLLRLGYFDGNRLYDQLGADDVCSADHRELATEAAREGIVLLKNADNTLPLDASKVKTVSVSGPHANATDVMIGNYAGIPCGYATPLDELSKRTNVSFAEGCRDVLCASDAQFAGAVAAANVSDATVIFAGLNLKTEAEGLDRNDLLLPGKQTDLILKIASSSKGPVILVILSGGCVDLTFAQNHPNVKAIIWAGYPGEKGGAAIADVIFGDYNPGGRLPITWYLNNYTGALPMTSMPLRPLPELGYPGRTYKFFNGTTLYPFGYGLSYTTFKYAVSSATAITVRMRHKQLACKELNYAPGTSPLPRCPAVLINSAECHETIKIDVDVTNSGSRGGSNVVLVYSAPPKGILNTHIKQVIGFQRVYVNAGETSTVTFKISACKGLDIIDDQTKRVLPHGMHTIIVGDGHEAVSFPLSVEFAAH